jgi:Arc/MetJ family transcription regulator
MAVTSVDIDTDMLREAKHSYGVRTNREAINLALRDVVMRRRQLEALDVLSTLELDEDAPMTAHAE